MFNNLTSKITETLQAGDVEAARKLLDIAWQHANDEAERKRAHDLGNVIQREIFNQYVAAN